VRARRALLTDLALVFPLLLVYEVAAPFMRVRNGVDLITDRLIPLVGWLPFELGLIALFVGLVIVARRSGERLDARAFVPVLLESAVYALTMGTLIVFVMLRVLHVDPGLAIGAPAPLALAGGLGTSLFMAVGAGVHEELVFRLGLVGGGTALLEKVLGVRPFIAAAAAIVFSSLVFSAAHHVGPLGDPLRVGIFTYRVLAGLFFALLYRMRGLAVAVYTHALYDIYVMVLR
jgi:hypothetical protein